MKECMVLTSHQLGDLVQNALIRPNSPGLAASSADTAAVWSFTRRSTRGIRRVRRSRAAAWLASGKRLASTLSAGAAHPRATASAGADQCPKQGGCSRCSRKGGQGLGRMHALCTHAIRSPSRSMSRWQQSNGSSFADELSSQPSLAANH